MWKFILLSLASIQLSQGFDIDGWVKKYCVRDTKVNFLLDFPHTHNLYCENFSFTKQEREDMQKGDFVISNDKIIIFKGGDIGVLNQRFLKKFPHAENMVFLDVKVQVEESTEPIDHPVENLSFMKCFLSGIKDTHFFKNLINLKHLGFDRCKFDYSVLEKNLFGSESKLIGLSLEENDFAKINDDAFDGLGNLEILFLGADLENLSPHLLSQLTKLKELNLSRNKLNKIPCDAIPESIEELSLPGNKIYKPSFEGCKSFKNLKRLYLGGNDIKSIDESAFDHLDNLEELALDYNKIEGISNAHFKNLKKLKRINLDGNGIKKTDIRSDISVEL